MTVIPLPADRIVSGTVIQSEHPAGVVRFEEFARGDWLTLKGEPARKPRRHYFLNGECLPFSVSGIVGTIEKPALYRWHEDRGVRGGVKAERLGELEGLPEHEWADRVRSLDLGADAERDQAADRGNVIHDVFHGLARGEKPDSALLPEWAMPWYRGALRAWLALNPIVIEAEFLLCHPTQRYAGRADLYAICDGQRTLIDYKTSLKGRIWEQAHYQTRGYARAMPPSGLGGPDRVLIVAVDNDGGFEIEECQATDEQWDALVQVAHSRRDVADARTAARKAAEEPMKEAA